MAINNLKDLYMNYLISSAQLVTGIGLSKVLYGSINHAKFTHLLSKGEFNSAPFGNSLTKANAFALKYKIYYMTLKVAMNKINELSVNQYQKTAYS